MRPTRFLVSLVAVLSTLANLGFADDHAPMRGAIDLVLKARLYAEAPPAWDRTREAHRHVECVGRNVSDDFADGKPRMRSMTDWRVKVRGTSTIFEEAELSFPLDGGVSSPSASPAGPPMPPLTIEIRNERYRAAIGRKDASSQWTISFVDVFELTDDQPPRRRVLKATINNHQILMNWNTEIGMVPLPELIRDPNFELRSLIAVRVAGRDCIKVAFTYDPRQPIKEGGSPLRSGWFIVDPNFHWAVRSFGADLHVANVFSSENAIEYVANNDAETIPMMSSDTARVKSDYDYSWVSRTEFQQVTYRDIAADEFQLSHYGLPEPGEPSDKADPAAVEISWQAEPLEHTEATKATKFSVVVSNRSARTVKLLGFNWHCSTVGCLVFEPEPQFPIEIRAYGERTFSAEFTPRAAGPFEDSLEFYTDALGQLIVSETFAGEAR